MAVIARAPQPLTRQDIERLAMALIEREGPRYSMDVSRALGVRYGRARGALVNLEKKGELTSWLEEALGSGLGRRYYMKCVGVCGGCKAFKRCESRKKE